ncbi:MAG TPA: hydroxysqualene dehydroxylase HpnE [Alphaproteobacteria bacterium]|nr:hydroxysqualene dehydroxylase HpnE [Alphaproteobacteria bacterium]
MTHVHIVGAGLAGLSTALRLAERGIAVELYEAAPQAGGRCRSFYDERVDRVIDNGNHLMLGANRAAFSYMKAIGGDAAVTEVAPAAFPFFDLANGETWTIRPNAGRIPWWMFVESRRVPRTRARDYLSALRLLHPKPGDTVADRLDPRARLTAAFWEPLVVSVMNAPLEEAAALPLAAVLHETFGRGEIACRPWIALGGLSSALVEPALARLSQLGVVYHPGWRLMRIDKEIARVTALRFDAGTVDLGPDDRVVLAVPPHAANELLPGLSVPSGTRAIVNAHFRLPAPVRLPGGQPLLGLINGTVQWMIARDDIVSITVSAADALAEMPAEQLLPRLWRDVANVLGLAADAIPPVRLIKEKRATFLQSPANLKYRPAAVTAWHNLVLAGDWTDTGLPATIEGAVRSGEAAAAAVLRKG